MIKRFAALAALVVLYSGCFMTPKDIPPQATDDSGRAYLIRAMATPLTFSVPKEKGESSWSRINSFVSKYSSMKIQTASDYILETYNPSDSFHFAYSANRATTGDTVEFTVRCYCGGLLPRQKMADQNAHILALYAMTEEIQPTLISQ